MAGDSEIGYIRFGLGTSGEDFPVDGFAQGTCFGAWVAKGLSAARWLAWSTAQIDYEESLGSKHALNVGINSFPGARLLPDEAAAEAAKDGLGFRMQGMTVAQIGFAQSNPHLCYADWCSLFATWAARVPLEVQTLSPTAPAGGGTSGALPAQLAYVVAQAHAQVVQLYPKEWLVADDPAWPTFAQSHEAYAQGLARAASEVGG